MSEEQKEGTDRLVAVARAVKVRGLNGEIVADLLTDFPDRFADLSQLIAVAPDGERQVVELEGYWFHQSRVVLKLAGYDDSETAREFVGHEFAVPEENRVTLPEGHYYEWELRDFVVETANGQPVGQVRDVMRIGEGVEMLVVENDERHEHLIPMVQTIILEIDVAGKRILIDPPDGLLEL
ncbi:MAG: ribosome maturation factor RimM [Pyrinomonadaceae bacterium]